MGTIASNGSLSFIRIAEIVLVGIGNEWKSLFLFHRVCLYSLCLSYSD